MTGASIVDGKVVANYSETNLGTKSKGDNLGKDAFLQLLVAQMQHQDPLEPTDNTQMVTELAQFSSIEELQNLSKNMDSQNAFSLVGKNVIIEAGKSQGATTTTEVGGYVEYVKMVEGKPKLSVGGELYDYDDLQTVIDEAYLASILDKKEK